MIIGIWEGYFEEKEANQNINNSADINMFTCFSYSIDPKRVADLKSQYLWLLHCLLLRMEAVQSIMG